MTLLAAACAPSGAAQRPDVGAAAAHGGAQHVPEAPGAPEKPPAHDGMEVEGTLGRLGEDQIAARLKEKGGELRRCFEEQSAQRWYLGGALELKLRVDRDGAAQKVAVTRSDLGSYEVERCVVRVVRAVRFPAPEGGEAEFTYPLEFSPQRGGVSRWPDAKVEAAAARRRKEVSACAGRRAPQNLRLTVYIGPGGVVASAGLSADEPIEDKVGSCLVARAQGWRFEDPLGQLVKASMAWN